MHNVKYVPFGELYIEPSRNGVTKPKKVRGVGTKIINMGELFRHDRINNVQCDRAPLTEKEMKSTLLRAGDLLFARQSLVLSGAGKCSIFTGDDEPTTFESHIIRVRIDRKRASPEFYYYLLRSSYGRALIQTIVEQGAGASGIRGSDLSNLLVPLPAIDTQIAIAETLAFLDDKIDLNRRMNETLEAMARALFKDWFVDFGPTKAKMEGRAPYLAPEIWNLFPDRLDNDGKPEGWKYGTLSDLAETNSESWTNNKHPEFVDYVDLSNTKWGTIESVSRLAWTKAPSRARRIAKVGDTIIGTTRPGNGSFAYISQSGLTISTGFAVLTPKKTLYQDFVYVAASAPSNINRLANLADGHGGAYPAVKPSEVAETEVAIASEQVFVKYAEIASEMRNKIETAKLESRSLSQTRDFLLPKLMSGEVRVGDAEKQLGSSL